MWKLPKWLTPPKGLNSLQDLINQSAALTEIIALAVDVARHPGDVQKALALKAKLEVVGLM